MSCRTTEVWLVDKREDSGIIGYQLGNTSDANDVFNRQFEEKAKSICGNSSYKVVRDILKSKDYSRTVIVPQQSTTNSEATVYGSHGSSATAYGSSTTTTYVPQVYTATEYWRDAKIQCKGCTGRVGFNLDKKNGNQILRFAPESKAEEARLKIGDRVITIGGNRVEKNEALLPGGQAEIIIERDGKVQSFNVEIINFCH